MKKLLLILALLFAPASTWAQCNGIFPSGTVCGNPVGSPNIPGPLPLATFALAPAGSSGQIQLNGGSGQLSAMPSMSGSCTLNTSTGVISCSGRKLLTTTTNFYIDRTSGTDTIGCGLASGASACQTPQYLTNIIATNYDLGNQATIINFAHSASNYAPFTTSVPWVGGNNVTYLGDVASQSSVVIDGAGGNYCAQANEYASFTIRGLTVQNCLLGLSAPEQHVEIYFDHITWSSMPTTSIGIYASRQAYAEAIGGGNIINSIGANFIQTSHQGNFRAAQSNTSATVFTLGANITGPAGCAFAYASSGGDITFTQYSASPFNLNGHTVTNCSQWSADSNGLFQNLNASTGLSMTPNFFPGSSVGFCLGDCSIDQGAHTGTTLSSCGTSPSMSGNDFYGKVVEGTTATGCLVVFNSAFTQAPYCQITWLTAVPGTLTVATSTAVIGLTHSSTSGATFFYQCKGF
jgi:hypothetical protein